MAKKKAQAKKTAGRPSKFDERYIEEAEKLTMLGLTDRQLADFWEVSVATLFNWQKAHPEFLEAARRGKAIADGTVARSLYERANGYSHPAVKILQYEGQPVEVPYTERYAPDTSAAVFWLKNRRPDLWRDKTEVLNKTPASEDGAQPITTLQIAREIAFALTLGVTEATKSAEPDTKH